MVKRRSTLKLNILSVKRKSKRNVKETHVFELTQINRFMKVFTPIRPTIYSITDYFFTKNPDKLRNIRVDTLSQLLTMANVRANAKLLVVDDTQGLIVSSCLERMGGYGKLVAIHDGDYHNYDIMRYMSFPKSIQNTLYTVPLAMVDPSAPEGKR